MRKIKTPFKGLLIYKGKKYNTRTFEDETWDTIEHGPAINKKQEKTRNKRIAKQIAKRSKYQQGGGMYAENVIPAGMGSTAMTVYQEDNPELQKQRLAALDQEKADAMKQSEEMAKEIEADKEGDQAAATAASQQAQGSMEAGMQTLGLASQTADAAGLFGKGTGTAAQQTSKDKQSLVGSLRSARDIYSATRQAKKSIKLVKGFNEAKTAFDVK